MKEYLKGVYLTTPRENAPDFIIGEIVIDVNKIDFSIAKDNGKIYATVYQGKEQPYVAINDYMMKKEPKSKKDDGVPVE